MKLVLEMGLGDAEFHRDGEEDADQPADGSVVAEHLEKLAARVREEALTIGDGGRIISINGNAIGTWKVEG